jgi:hypothetical protein
MSTPALPSCRVITFSSSDRVHKAVVIISTAANLSKDSANHSIKQYMQLTAAQAMVGIHPTFMDGTSQPNANTFPVIYISGYSSPS